MWNAARVTGCELPIALTGCDAVRIYLAKYPAGAHVDEANKAIAAGEPQLLRLQKDENAWQQAGVATCRSRSSSTASGSSPDPTWEAKRPRFARSAS